MRPSPACPEQSRIAGVQPPPAILPGCKAACARLARFPSTERSHSPQGHRPATFPLWWRPPRQPRQAASLSQRAKAGIRNLSLGTRNTPARARHPSGSHHTGQPHVGQAGRHRAKQASSHAPLPSLRRRKATEAALLALASPAPFPQGWRQAPPAGKPGRNAAHATAPAFPPPLPRARTRKDSESQPSLGQGVAAMRV